MHTQSVAAASAPSKGKRTGRSDWRVARAWAILAAMVRLRKLDIAARSRNGERQPVAAAASSRKCRVDYPGKLDMRKPFVIRCRPRSAPSQCFRVSDGGGVTAVASSLEMVVLVPISRKRRLGGG